MLRDDFSGPTRLDVVTIPKDEYASLIRSAAQLDAILLLGEDTRNELCRKIYIDRNPIELKIEKTEG